MSLLVDCFFRTQLETDLKIEREWRQTLQSELERERETIAQLTTEAQQINGLKKVSLISLSSSANIEIQNTVNNMSRLNI